MRTAFTVLLAAFMLTAPAAADTYSNPYFTLETSLTASPNVIQVGDRATFVLTLTLSANPDDDAKGVTVFGSAFPGFVDIHDGSAIGPYIGGGQIPGVGLPGTTSMWEFKSAPYQTPGDFLATVTGQIEVSIGCSLPSTICPQGANPWDLYGFINAQTTVSVVPVSAVPGPILGTGLPGLIIAIAGLFGWLRRKAYA